jgi:hypothetical protein
VIWGNHHPKASAMPSAAVALAEPERQRLKYSPI